MSRRRKHDADKGRQDHPPGPDGLSASSSKRLAILLSIAVTLPVLLIYSRTFHYPFVYYDDEPYVYDNPMVKGGLSAAALIWAFTTNTCANWHPLTWISYLVDQRLFGMNAGAEHAVNVVFHAGAAGLLFWALFLMTRRPWRCALVAAIFGLHPLHVESVAWIAERKDVLSTFFEALALLLYARYVNRPGLSRYAYVALAFALSLLAKPMAVTLPLVLLLLDVWPLQRLKWPFSNQNAKRLLWEKAPLLALSAGASVLAVHAQRTGGAIVSLASLPFTQRLANAATAYAGYLAKAIWPADLAVLYPLGIASPMAVTLAVFVLAVITGTAVLCFRGRPYILIGWAWFIGTLVPTIGLIQVGRQSLADRYTYVPLVGLSLAVVWFLSDATERSSVARNIWTVAALIVMAGLSLRTYDQLSYWENSETLFRHTIAVTGENPIIEGNLGVVLQREGRREEAAVLYRKVLVADPGNAGARTNLGEVMAEQGKYDEAVSLYREALASSPGYPDAHYNLGREYLRAGRLVEALQEFSVAVRLKPDSAQFQGDLGVALAAAGRYAEAGEHLGLSCRLDPEKAVMQSGLCFVLGRLGRAEQAMNACQSALRLRPDLLEARLNLGNVLASQGNVEAAAAEFRHALAQDPNYAPARAALENLQGLARR